MAGVVRAVRVRFGDVFIMSSGLPEEAIEVLDLFQSLNREWIKLPLAAVCEVGPAAQTLGGLLKVTSTQTFVAISKISSSARVPARTVKRHLASLAKHGWIEARGRERTRSGRPRRTNTLAITAKARDASKTAFGVLPFWACFDAIPPITRRPGGMKRPGKWKGLTWGARVVLSLVMARLMALKAKAVEEFGELEDSLLEGIDHFGGDERFRFSLAAIERETGLDRKTIVLAKRLLNRVGMVRWVESHKRADGGTDTDYLIPNVDHFAVRVVPTAPGFIRVEWLPNGRDPPVEI